MNKKKLVKFAMLFLIASCNSQTNYNSSQKIGASEKVLDGKDTVLKITKGKAKGTQVSLPTGALAVGTEIDLDLTSSPAEFPLDKNPKASEAISIAAMTASGIDVTELSSPMTISIPYTNSLSLLEDGTERMCALLKSNAGLFVWRYDHLTINLASKRVIFSSDKMGTFQLAYCGHEKLDGFEEAYSDESVFISLLDKVSVKNNKITFEGSGLKNVTGIQIISQDGFNELFSIDSTSESTIIASSVRNITLALDKALSVVMTNAEGAEQSYQITFKLNDGSITASMLHQMGATNGDVLIYNSAEQKWEPKSLNGLNYKGVWDATVGIPPSATPNAGEYWIVSVAGATNLDGNDEWYEGDWAIYNGTEWQQISNGNKPVPTLNSISNVEITSPTADQFLKWNGSSWEAASLTNLSSLSDVGSPATMAGQVLKWNGSSWEAATDDTAGMTFNGRSGVVLPEPNDYTWAQINKSTSSLADIASSSLGDINDVNTAAVADGYVLKWNATNSNWEAAVDATAAPGSIGSAAITDNSIINADISASANIDQSKINNLTNDLSNKVSADGSIPMTANLNLGNYNLINLATPSGLTDAATKGYVDSNVSSISSSYINKDGSNSMANDLNLGSHNITNLLDPTSPQHAATKNYVDAEVSTKFSLDGSVAMGGDLSLGNNSLKFTDGDTNYIEFKTLPNITSDITFTLPGTKGTLGSYLMSDGAGGMSWSTPSPVTPNTTMTGLIQSSVAGNNYFTGSLGIGTTTPSAKLEVAGTVKAEHLRLSNYATEPFACSSDKTGTLALTDAFKMCVCNGSQWVFTSDGATTCVWM